MEESAGDQQAGRKGTGCEVHRADEGKRSLSGHDAHQGTAEALAGNRTAGRWPLVCDALAHRLETQTDRRTEETRRPAPERSPRGDGGVDSLRSKRGPAER